MDVFPLPAGTRYDYAQRFDPRPRGHHGTDVFADRDTPLLAVESGRVRRDTDPRGGLVVYLEQTPSGSRYYYAHCAELIGDFPRTVIPGEPIATVGNTGNAFGKPPHLHFQISPPGGGVIDPFPELVRTDPRRGARVPALPAPGEAPPQPSSRSELGVGLGLLLLLWMLGRGNSHS